LIVLASIVPATSARRKRRPWASLIALLPKARTQAMFKAAVEPLITAISDRVGALWTRHVEKDKFELETKKRTQLEAAKWPKFGDIAAQ
jgi:hypothetical protein